MQTDFEVPSFSPSWLCLSQFGICVGKLKVIFSYVLGAGHLNDDWSRSFRCFFGGLRLCASFHDTSKDPNKGFTV